MNKLSLGLLLFFFFGGGGVSGLGVASLGAGVADCSENTLGVFGFLTDSTSDSVYSLSDEVSWSDHSLSSSLTRGEITINSYFTFIFLLNCSVDSSVKCTGKPYIAVAVFLSPSNLSLNAFSLIALALSSSLPTSGSSSSESGSFHSSWKSRMFTFYSFSFMPSSISSSYWICSADFIYFEF
jgi:hypothetical protein